MKMIACKVREWGNSLGVIIPRTVADELGIKPNEEIIVKIEKKNNVLRELFGSLKFKTPPEKLIGEIRSEMESKWS